MTETLASVGANGEAGVGRRSIALEDLKEGQTLSGFRTEAVYLDDADRPMGARFVHEGTGFTLDYLRIQSVPQAFLWVNTFPTSDKGEPHTQEHLLLGKGNKGRYVASLEDMSLANSSAFTMQWRTCYHFHTAAGPDVFFNLFEAQLDALLNPNYTDEEIRREVRNFGVTVNPTDKTLRLEEKGTVYNEMVSSFERPFRRLSRELDIVQYGANHPLALSSGGFPDAIREMTPEDIRRFHRDHYHLANMGVVAAFPKEQVLESVLGRLDRTLTQLRADTASRGPVRSEADLPRPSMAAPGTIVVTGYPHENPKQPGPVMFSYPPTLDLGIDEKFLLDLFLDNVAGDATTNLYKLFVDSKTRKMDIGAQSVFAGASSDQGVPIYFGLNDVAAENLTEAKLAEVRAVIRDEMARIASWEDGSAELAEFNARIANRVVESRRSLSKFVNSPPGFGYRGTGSGWMTHLYELGKTGEFERSVTMKPQLAFVERLLAGKKNFWREYIDRWGLVERVPYGAAARANPDLIRQEETERQARVTAEVGRLKARFGIADEQEAIRRYQSEYDSATASLEEISKGAPVPKFVESPPLTLDDQLDYRVETLRGGVPVVASTFDNMTSATVGLALRLDMVPEEELFYLSLLPGLMTQVGVLDGEKAVSYDEMRERMRQEILSLNAYYSSNFLTGRCELVVRGAGNDTAEAERAVDWMRLTLMNADWRPENLARIRDYVDQSLSNLRRVMQGSEESWVNDPARAYWRQENPLLMATGSFLTRDHNVHRLRWQLKDAGPEAERAVISEFLERLGAAGKGASRDDLALLVAKIQGTETAEGELPEGLQPIVGAAAALPGGARTHALDVARTLELLLTDLPDETLDADWRYLCAQMRRDLLMPPAEALAALGRVRERILRAGSARTFLIASTENQKRLVPRLEQLVGGLKPGAAPAVSYATSKLVDRRLAEHAAGARPVFVGLVNPNTRGGVFLNSAPGVRYKDTDRDSLIRFLASKLYAGGGAHGIFMKTWGAGLAYSNGIGGGPGGGRLSYYAERCPELPQTLQFVVGELERAEKDPALVEYAIAQAFGEFRSASGYETRGEAMSNDLADGVRPEVVAEFRRAILKLRGEPGLADRLFELMPSVYGRVLPGYGEASSKVEDGVFMVIGPEKQFELYEEYLQTVEGKGTKLFRLFPRDFWMTARL